MVAKKTTFKRGERLKHRKLIKALFKSPTRKHVFPIQILYNINAEIQTPFPAQAAFVIPKKNFRKTTHRNILKRRMKEAYRLHKHILYSELSDSVKPLSMIFIYSGKEQQPYRIIEEAMVKVIDKVIKDCNRS